MKTDLAYIDKAFATALDAESKQKATPSAVASLPKVLTQSLCGFQLPDEAVRERELAGLRVHRLKQLAVYREGASQLHMTLSHVGIQPLAVMTTKAWEKIRKDAGLYDVSPDRNGGVTIGLGLIRQLRGEAQSGLGSLTCMGAIAMGFGFAALMFLAGNLGDAEHPGASAFSGIGAMAVALFTAMALDRFCDVKILPKRYDRAVDQFLAGKTWDQVLMALTADTRRLYSDQYGYDDTRSVKIQLPTPPPEVMGVLLKLQGLAGTGFDPRVACEADAISFVGGVKQVFKGGLERLAAFEAAERARAADPIIYITNGSATAIVAQFGDFPIEREAIDQVLASEYLL